ncbi:unnamed protein product [Mytilus edulis]|uniref:B box-type domain-containing protein n=1 Tax=Mytilus edulis TaxID=6550 RepID=A0A8S3Q7P1_MYTED|nr:unnamed protein product [Mytilus edulis]
MSPLIHEMFDAVNLKKNIRTNKLIARRVVQLAAFRRPKLADKNKDIRNALVHHGTCSMEMNEFESLWKALEDNVLNYAGVVALTHKKKVKTEIQKLKEETSFEHLKEVVKHSSENIQRDKGITDMVNANCRVDDPEFDAEIMAANNLNQPNSTNEEFAIKSIENKCVFLALEVSRLVLTSKEALEFAVNNLIKKIIKTGNIDTKIKRTVKMELIIKGQITKGLRRQESLICCQSCLDKEKPAFYGCKECDKYMCEQCNAKHNTDPAFIDHKTKYIDPLKYKVKDTYKIRGIKIQDIKMLNDELLVVADGKETN